MVRMQEMFARMCDYGQQSPYTKDELEKAHLANSKMPRGLAEPSRITKILQHLKKEPRPLLPAFRSLKLTYAFRNDHFGARHFVKEDLPRIAYSNPTLEIAVNKIPKKPEDVLVPEMEVVFRNGESQRINMDNKWSTAILEELLNLHSRISPNIKVKPGDLTFAGESGGRKTGRRMKV
ncbi:hypothetical protein Clacol_008105 [Clathrus columnatus]|uniref:Ribosomal protein/NADH dehydrogenase domain-containing protein n=1 Tax=Clathrus columnatus TaxID=1419009 RepID=A0AAV5AK35_9AGAM|nr:hypothetical protein Clacol_008105 [Clathrus columnatus]